MATLQLKNVDKIYENKNQAVFDFNLDIQDKEFIVFVGPSGCGKSTTLRMIAGLEEISNGEFYIDDVLMNDTPSKDRNIAMVFQSYALYPHMTVFENMAFGLKIRKVDEKIIREKVSEAAEVLGLTEYLTRKPKALSGGQRQRVALGRAIVRNPKVFLMDEPLSNLDAKLRVAMRSEIIRLHRELGATTIYVTHDQTEAMTMADRIVVMKDGYVQQIGTPKEIYDTPVNMFVAGFTGAPSMNFINGHLDNGVFHVGENSIPIPAGKLPEEYNGKEIVLGIRPEDIHSEGIVKDTYKEATIEFTVDVNELLGHESIIYTSFEGHKLQIKINSRISAESGDKLHLAFDLNKIHFFDKDTEVRIDK